MGLPRLLIAAGVALAAGCTARDVIAFRPPQTNDAGVDAGPDLVTGCPGPVVLPGASRSCSTTLASSKFTAGVCSCRFGGMTSVGDLRVDGFDSAAGAYDPGATNPGGDVRSNSLVSLGGTTTITGSFVVFSPAGVGLTGASPQLTVDEILSVSSPLVDASQDGVVIARSDAYVEGALRLLTLDVTGVLHRPSTSTTMVTNAIYRGGVVDEHVAPAFPCPCVDRDPFDLVGLIAAAATENENASIGLVDAAFTNLGAAASLTLPCGRFHLTGVTGSAPLTIAVTGHAALFVDQDVDVAPLTIAIAPGASLDLFVGGSIALRGPAELGDPAHPTSLRVYVAGTSAIAFAPDAAFAGELFTLGDVTLPASYELFGSVLGDDVLLGGDVDVHEDLAVGSLPGCLVP